MLLNIVPGDQVNLKSSIEIFDLYFEVHVYGCVDFQLFSKWEFE